MTNVINLAERRALRGAATASDDEALFLRCILQCQNDFGTKPPAELALPRSIGVVVDYDYVKRMMFTLTLQEFHTTAEGWEAHRKWMVATLKAARARLMAIGVVGCEDPFVWWTGKPVGGVAETQKRVAHPA